MCKNKILEKLLAIILIFTLTFANFAFATESIAMSIAKTLFGKKADTGHKNVEFEAYFGTEEEKETSVISDVNNQELCINLDLGIKSSGYLKNGKIEILEFQEGENLNFKVKEDIYLSENIQDFENNVIYLNQIDFSDEKNNISLPIMYENEDYVSEEKLSKDARIKFSGIYVDEDGEEVEVSREITLNISWKDEREVRIESDITKYIDFEDRVILQTSVKIDNSTDKNTLPIKKSKVEIKAPVLDEKTPTKVTVVANSTEGTNGKKAGDVIFNEENWYYNQESGLLTITVENEKQLVEINKNAEQYLKEADEEIEQEERYYSKSGIDEYFITYTFENGIMNETTILTSEILAETTLLSGVENDDFINVITSENDVEYSFEGKTGDIVSLNIENETKEISKAYMYSNYNHNSKYQIEHNTKTILNIAYKEFIEEIYIEDVKEFYEDEQQNNVVTEDFYYKQLSISKENFDKILGETGRLDVCDLNQNIIATIDNESEIDENGNFIINFENKIDKVIIKISAPVEEGNFVINKTREIANVSIDKETLKSMKAIGIEEKIKVKHFNIDNVQDIQKQSIYTNLLDTTTKANLVIDRNSLSTLAMNENVELRIELNNATDKSDLYGHSVFEIELPSDLESVEIINSKLVYGEGLEITKVEVIDRIIRITLDGVQEGINSGILTNGTNITLNANIKLNLYSPAKTEKIKLRYTNDEATNYETNGYEELEVEYSAPTGLVAVNSISNYDSKGSTVTSVRQGYKEDIIDVYAEAKTSTMEIILMNNNNNEISDLSILGRIPFKGVKDIISGNDLGATVDTKLISNIISDEHNNVGFDIYYSTNGEATKSLDDLENGWTRVPENLETIKSYLIVPADKTYEMEETEILKFTYQYEIPENLSHNENIFGTFIAYYINHSEVATTEETSVPDLVGLTTGKGPELDISIKVNKEVVKELEEIETTITVKNIGKQVAQDIILNIPTPQYTKYKRVKSEKENLTIENTDQNVKILLGEIKENEEVDIKVFFNVEKIQNIEEEIIINAYVTAKDLGKDLVSNTENVKITKADYSLYLYASDTKATDGIQEVGTELEIMIQIKNLTSNEKNNVVVTQEIPLGFDFVNANVCSENFVRLEKTANYNEETRVITWNIDNIKANYSRCVAYKIKIAELPEGITKQEIRSVAKITENGEVYNSNTLLITSGKAVLTIHQIADVENTYIKEGTCINYIYTIKNEGTVAARSVKLVNETPDGLIIRNIKLNSNGFETNQQLSSKTQSIISLTIMPKEEAKVTIKAYASNLKGVQEKTVTNLGVLKLSNSEEIKSNSITHIIEATEKNVVNKGDEDSFVGNGSTSNDIVKTYKITGVAWLDSNENGMRDAREQLMPGISAKLINNETGVITKSVTTDNKGTYIFEGVQNGKYLIIFDYDTAKYTVTTYQKTDIATNVNSDAITAQIEQNGTIRNGAVTDVIEIKNGSISNIDIGFIYADMFDLQLEKTITKVTVQTSKGTTNSIYDKATLAKAEIHSKYVSGSTVYVEYTITVRNVGEIAGYAKKIVDYIPEGMIFNSSLEANKNWYTGTDQKLYTTALSNIELAAGQSMDIKLVLIKNMTSENTGPVSNLAEIYEAYNIYGVTDENSIPANKAQGENDLGKADVIITVKTGEVFINISLIITSILLGSVAVFIIYNSLMLRKRKGGA